MTTIRPRSMAWALLVAAMLTGPAGATGSAIQQLRSTEGLRTAGPAGVGTGTGIYTKHQRRKFGYGRSRVRVAPPR